MSINYHTKEESNRLQEEEFLKLAPHDRFMLFLKMIKKSKQLFPDTKDRSKNFQIVIQQNDK